MIQNYYNVYSQIVAPGDSNLISALGDFVRCVSSSADFEISIDDYSSAFFTQGLGLSTPDGTEFSKVRITNVSAMPLEVKLAIGRGSMQDSRLALTDAITVGEMPELIIQDMPAVVLSVPTTLNEGSDESISNNSSDMIFPTFGQREIIIAADPDNGGPIRVGPSATVSQGLKIYPGQTLTLNTNAVFYIKNNSGGTNSYTLLQVSE